jgi:regulator of protease activity HflC (stomatin/prohibitin superfamily)
VLIAVAMGLDYFEVTVVERIVTYVIPAVMTVVGIELILNLVLDIYRPRVAGQERRPPYDSRLLGLFAEPQGVLKTVAATLDYQFGFKVSDTWFYQFMERAIVPLLMVQVASLWLLTMIVVVDPNEVAFIEVLGRPVATAEDAEVGIRATAFQPGFHLKWPWPIAFARHVPAYDVHSVEVGKMYVDEMAAQETREMMEDNVILWTEPHILPGKGYEVNFLVPSTAALEEEVTVVPEASEAAILEGQTLKAPEVNLARLKGLVHYRVHLREDGSVDPDAAFTYCYRQADIERHMERLAYRALCRVAASQDFIRWMAEERQATIDKFRALVEEAVEREELALDIVYAGIPVVHPPESTAPAFERVVAAMEEREALRYEGELEYARAVQGARALSAELISAAEGYAGRMLTNAEAERDKFLVQLQSYEKAPIVYTFRTYFDTLERVLDGMKVYVLPTGGSEVQIIDMKQRLRPQLLDLDAEE